MTTRSGSRSLSLSRRAFLRRLTALGLISAAGSVMAGCATQPQEAVAPTAPPAPTEAPAIKPTEAVAKAPTEAPVVQPTQAAEATQPPAATVAPHDTPAPAPATEVQPAEPAVAQPAYLAVAHGTSPEAMVRATMDAIGGMGHFVSKGDDVIIKPNICVAYHTYEYAATTNPDVVGALVALALDAGAKRVRVMDYPFGGTPQAAYDKSGIGDTVKVAGGKMEVMTPLKFRETEIPGAADLHAVKIYQDALDADVLIDVPIAKHHSMAGLTLAMKNLMGLIENRPVIHRNFKRRLPDLASILKPDLIVVDAVRILTDHGPTGGNLDDVKLTNTVIASHDIVAADAYATSLFGMAPDDISYIVGGAEAGLGTKDLSTVDVRELDV